jgi:hypothetical protein
VETVQRLGKQIGLGLANGSGKLWLAIHLRMTGRLITEENRAGQNDKHLRATLVFDRGSLLFYDTRRFGTIRYSHDHTELLSGAVDPMTDEFTVSRLAELIGGATTTPVKNWLLRQDKLVGIGNLRFGNPVRLRDRPAHPGGQAEPGQGEGAAGRDPAGAGTGDRELRHHVLGFPGQPGTCRRVSGFPAGLCPRERAMPRLRDNGPADCPGPAFHVLLPKVPEVAARRTLLTPAVASLIYTIRTRCGTDVSRAVYLHVNHPLEIDAAGRAPDRAG